MNKLIEEFLGSHGQDAAASISSKLGLDVSQVSNMLPQIASPLFDGIKNNLQSSEGGIGNLLGSLSGGNLGANLEGLLSGGGQQGSILDTILGSSKSGLISSIAEKFNLSGDTISKVVSMVIPMLISFLGNKTKGEGLSGITKLLDADGDGNIIDGIGGMLGSKGKEKGIAGALGDLF